jgi:hypothetical protein
MSKNLMKLLLIACFSAPVALSTVLVGSASAENESTPSAGVTTPRPRPVPGLGVTIGDTVATVKEVFKTDLDPEPYRDSSSSPGDKKPRLYLNLRTKGVAFFFVDGEIDLIRIDAPSSTAIGGLQLGDTLGKLTQLRGKPIRQWDFGDDDAHLYALDDEVYVRYDVGKKSKEIVRIFLFK